MSRSRHKRTWVMKFYKHYFDTLVPNRVFVRTGTNVMMLDFLFLLLYSKFSGQY